MGYAQPVVDYLKADATLLSYLTGGIYIYSDAGRNGLNRLQIPGAYDSVTGFVKPVAIVAEMDLNLDFQAVSSNTGRFSLVSDVFIRILDHGDNGYDTIALAAARIKTLIHCKPQIIANAWQLILTKTMEDRRDTVLKDACYFQQQFQVHGWIS